ncbi:MAG: chorismate-binding protein [Lishizhenia sp.]
MEVVLYRTAGKPIQKHSGKWKLSTFSEMEEDAFFVTTFSKDKCYTFLKEELNNEIEISNFNASLTVQETKEEYLRKLTTFRDEFEVKGIKKAIFSRVIEKSFNKNPVVLFEKLCAKYPTAFVYLISSKLFGTWIGATPETLLSFEKDRFSTMSLAGTKRDDSVAWTEKEIEEQQLVTDFIQEELTNLQVKDLNVSETFTTYTGSVFHLKTDISFQSSLIGWTNIANVLHPTPAVCGIPTKKAYAHILASEKHNRDFYAGIIGFKENKQLHTFVNLRCMQVHQNNVSLYVGGGITSKSIPEDEFLETENKANTLLNVLQEI